MSLKTSCTAFIFLISCGADNGVETNESEKSEVSIEAGANVSNGCAPYQPQSRAAEPEVPRLQVQTVDCSEFDLADYRGRWVVVNFWATWCAPCLKEIPDFNELAKGRSDIQFIGLAYEEISRVDMLAFYETQVRPQYPIAIIDTYQPPEDFETPRGLPMTYIIDPNGRVAKKFLGPVTSIDLIRVIDDNTGGVNHGGGNSILD